ncbi:Fc.00g064640.m01.CDS01 [Cosmosporella sp. VM-42]
MAATYKQFLVAPNSSLLADTAALHYVTTTTSFSGPTQIIKHLNALQKQITKKKEDILNTIDGGNVIVLEVDTGLGFQTGGSAYLPGLDDNFLSGRVAYLPITHIVTFDAAGKISQIRLQWDQGSLLKQIEIIGKSGLNWPIRDSREQLTLIQACIKSASTAVASSTTSTSTSMPAPDRDEVIIRTRGNSQAAFRDSHAAFFGSRDESEGPPGIVSPYGGTRPQQRTFTEILGDEPEPGSPSANRYRSMSPSKGGQGKNFQPMRIFDGNQEVQEADVPKEKRYIRPNPTKYSHFDFADGSDPQDAPEKGHSIEDRPKSKHDSQWDFGDFVTPQKAKPGKTLGLRSQDVRHWDTDKESGVTETPVHQQPVKARRDAETHFELQDDGEPVPHADRPGARPKGYAHNEGLGLYKNQLFDREDPAPGPDRALGNITNLKGRNNDFDPHFNITDDSPSQPQQPHHIPEARKKAVNMMNANWSSYDQSPTSQKENNPLDGQREPDKKIHIAGDGMGGRKGTNRDWLYGETEPQDQPRNVPGRKQQGAAPVSGANQSGRIHIAGDGMGGKKGTDRDWLYGETEPQDQPKNVPGRKQGHQADDANTPKEQRINIAGDGMGGRKGTDRDWLYGETEPQDQPKNVPGRKQGTSAQANDTNQPKDQRINIAGDGMGGRKGTNRDWLYGELDEAAQQAAPPTRKQNAATTGKKDFWDF